MASHGITAHPPSDRCNEYVAAVDIYELHNTVLREKTCHSDICQPPVPCWVSCNCCRVFVVRNLTCGTESTWTLIKSFLLPIGQDQCPQHTDCGMSDTAAVSTARWLWYVWHCCGNERDENESQLFRIASIKIRNKFLKNHSRNSTTTTLLTLYDKEFASLESSLLKKFRFHIRWASLCFSLCFEGKCFEKILLACMILDAFLTSLLVFIC
jgi:hypothetical protein